MADSDSHSSNLEGFYQAESTQTALREGAVKGLSKKMWRLVFGLMLLCGVWLSALVMYDQPSAVAMTIGLYLFGVLICFIAAATLGVILAAIPLKKYDYNVRLDFLIPCVLIGIGVIGTGILLFLSIQVIR